MRRNVKFIVSTEVAELFPDLRIAILTVRQMDNHGEDSELQQLKEQAALKIYNEHTYETLSKLAQIEAWRDAYRAFGVNPKNSRPTAEAFLRRLTKGESFPTISKAVDSYLLVETEYFLPVGGYDLEKLQGDIVLRRSPGAESFVPIGGVAEELTRPGEVVYTDDTRVLTRKWNFKDCDNSKITESSTSIVLFTEAPFANLSTESLQSSVSRMAELITNSCGGYSTTSFLDVSTSRTIELPNQ